MISRRIIITGGNGNLCRQLMPVLVERDNRLLSIDLSVPPENERAKGVEYLALDITDSIRISRVLDEFAPDTILHFASLLSSSSEENRESAWNLNATATFHLLRIAAHKQVQSFFYPSTGATYAQQVPDPLPEDYPQWPDNLYGVTKVAVERLGVYFNAKHNLDFRCLRLPMVISPYAPSSAVSAYASHAFKAAVDGKDFTFPVSPEAGISTIYVRDVIQGILDLMDAQVHTLTRRVYNIHAFSPSAQDIADTISLSFPMFRYRFNPHPGVDALLRNWPSVHDDTHARRDWNWNPQYDLDRTADDLFAFFRANP